MITKQEAINKVWQYFIIDKNPPGYDIQEHTCKYYTWNGTTEVRCAIGCLLTREQLSKLDQGLIITAQSDNILAILQLEGYQIKQPDTQKFNSFWYLLQRAHDEIAEDSLKRKDFHNEFKESLIDLAEEYSLTINFN